MVESLRVEKLDFGTRFLGSGADLVRAGLVRHEQLPGPNGPRKHSAVYYGGVPASRGRAYPHDERYMKITLVGPDKFSVLVWCSREERESKHSQLRAEIAARCAAADARERARSHAADQLASLPASPEAYKERLVAIVDSFLDCAVSCVQTSDRHGFSFDERVLQQVKAAASQLRTAVRGGGVVFDARRHERAVAGLRERAGLPPERPRLRLVRAAVDGPPGLGAAPR